MTVAKTGLTQWIYSSEDPGQLEFQIAISNTKS